MATKYVLAFTIVAFWLFLPIPLMYMGVGGFNEINTGDLQNSDEPTTLGLILDFGGYISVYFQTMFFIIPNINFILARFVNLLQIMSGFLILVMIRGN